MYMYVCVCVLWISMRANTYSDTEHQRCSCSPFLGGGIRMLLMHKNATKNNNFVLSLFSFCRDMHDIHTRTHTYTHAKQPCAQSTFLLSRWYVYTYIHAHTCTQMRHNLALSLHSLCQDMHDMCTHTYTRATQPCA